MLREAGEKINITRADGAEAKNKQFHHDSDQPGWKNTWFKHLHIQIWQVVYSDDFELKF